MPFTGKKTFIYTYISSTVQNLKKIKKNECTKNNVIIIIHLIFNVFLLFPASVVSAQTLRWQASKTFKTLKSSLPLVQWLPTMSRFRTPIITRSSSRPAATCQSTGFCNSRDSKPYANCLKPWLLESRRVAPEHCLSSSGCTLTSGLLVQRSTFLTGSTNEASSGIGA